MRNALLMFTLLLSTASASAVSVGIYNPYKDRVLTEEQVCIERKNLDQILSYIGVSVQPPEGDRTHACFPREIIAVLLQAFDEKVIEDLSASVIAIRQDTSDTIENRMTYMCQIRETLHKSHLRYTAIGMTQEEWQETEACDKTEK